MFANKRIDCSTLSKIRSSFALLLRHKYILLSTVVVLELGLSLLIGAILDSFFPVAFENKGGLEFNSLSEEFIAVVFVAPLIETFLFQVLPIQIILKYLKSARLAILVSAVLFALQHIYSWVYVIIVLPSSLLFALYYTYSYKKNGGIWAFQAVVLVHAIHNLLAFLA